MTANTNAATDAATAQSKSKTGAGIIGKASGAYNADPCTITRRKGWNARFDFGEIKELAKSIRANSVLMPLRVKRLPAGGSACFELVDGDRRLTAIELILKEDPTFFDDTGVPIILVDRSQDDFTSLVQMFEANTGKPLLPMEEAAAFKRMADHAIEHESVKKADVYKWVAKHVGHSDIYVWETMQLLEASDEVKEAVTSKKIGTTAAKAITIHAKGDKAKQAELVKKAQAAGKDKAKKAELKKELDDLKRAKHAKKGRVLKIRALDDAALGALGKKVADDVAKKLAEANKPMDFDIAAWVASDDKLALAYAFGALSALKAAAGQKVELVI